MLAVNFLLLAAALFAIGVYGVIARRNAVMVLMSIERYVELERAGTPDLDLLTDRFDELYARMQDPGVADRTIAALDLRKSALARRRPAQPRSRRRG